MSDDEGGSKKSGYRLEYASSARAKCKGPKPCNGTPIPKGDLRFGSVVDFRGNTSFAWRHWGCVTSKIISNMKKSFEEADELDGFEELSEEDQDRVRKAWEEGHVADEDIPDTARKPDADEDEDGGKKKKKGKAVKKAKDEDDGAHEQDGDEEEKPAKKEKEDKRGVFKFEYASSGRAKCKGGCEESIGKDYLRFGHEVDFRGNKSFAWQHFGCVPDKLFTKFKTSYPEPTQVDGWDSLEEDDKEKVQRAWDNGTVPEDDQGPGEPRAGAPAAKKSSGKKTKKADDDNDEPPKKRAKKSKDEHDEEDEDKPKAKRAPAKKATAEKAKSTIATKKRVSKKKQADDEESGEDFAAEIDAVSDHEEEEEEGEKEESSEGSKKRKRAPASKASGSKPPSKSASKAKPASKAAAKPVSRRKKQQDEDDDE